MTNSTQHQSGVNASRQQRLGFPLAMLVGLVAFVSFFDVSILNPTHIDWLMAGDLGQHFIGWHAFRYDQWRLPITLTKLLGWPQGVPIVFTDSNPLLALPLKVIAQILPKHFQCVGAWYLICLVLQALFAYRLALQISGYLWFSLAAAALFVLYPPLLARLGHATLMGQWLILWAITLYLPPFSERRAWCEGLAILVFSIAVHFYLTGMVFPLVAGAVLFGSDDRLTTRFLPKLGALAAITAILVGAMALLGYFAVDTKSAGGYGFYSMNLNAPFNSGGQSVFLPALPAGSGQYEGYQYLGLGGLLLLPGAVILIMTRDRKKSPCSQPLTSTAMRSRIRFLLVYALGATLFAISSTVMLGDRVLVSFTLPPSLDSLAGIFRSSGRFFWPVAYLLFTGALIVFWTRARPIATPFLALVLLVQVVDILPMRDLIRASISRRTWHAELINTLRPFIFQADAVYVQGPWDKRNEALYASALLAAPQGVPLISVYSARPDDAHVVWEKAFWEELGDNPKTAENVLLVFPANWFLCIPGKTFLNAGDWNLMLPNRAVTTLAPAIPRFTSESGPRPDELVTGCTSACALVIVIRDKAPAELPERLVTQMSQRGSRIGNLGLRDSYLGVFENGKLRYEDFGQRRLRHETTLLNKPVTIESAGNGFGSLAAIRVEGIDHAPNRRGLNIVMLQSGEPPRAFSYDTRTELCR